MASRSLAITLHHGNWSCFRKRWRIGNGRKFALSGILSQPYSSLPRKRRRWGSPAQASVGDNDRDIDRDFDARYMPLVEWPKDSNGEVYTLLPIFRLPHLIHTRSGKLEIFFTKIAHKNPLWVSPVDAPETGRHSYRRFTQSPHRNRFFFVLHAWVTEGLAPGVSGLPLTIWDAGVLIKKISSKRMSSAWVNLQEVGKRTVEDAADFGSGVLTQQSDPDTQRVVVERCWRASEPYIPRASRPHHRHALLAPDGSCGAGQAATTVMAISLSTRIFPSRFISGGRR